MSMISSQCDKLLETADKIQRIKNNNTDWLWRDATTLTDAAEQMRDAADLILELRDDLQQANAKNEELREGAIMASTTFKCEFPRRQAMLSLWEKYVDCHGEWKFDTSTEVARVPVLVWPVPTQDGCFIVEHQNGHCQKVQPYELTFLGSKELFDQYDWREYE